MKLSNHKKKIYFISGLGADYSAFSYLSLPEFCLVDVSWIHPNSGETLKEYALRLKTYHSIPDDATVVGLSFGGMLTTELAKSFPNMRGILISSAKGRHEFPPSLRLLHRIRFHKWMPPQLHKILMNHASRYLGIFDREKIATYKEMNQRADAKMNQWSGGAILDWQNETVPKNIVHIHGTNDNVLPIQYIRSDYQIENGGHLMVMERADEVSVILGKLL